MSRPGGVVEQGYRTAARLTRRHGTTYFWGAALLPVEQRRHVHAIYAVCRLADDIVDQPTPGTSTARVRAELADFRGRLETAVAGGTSADPVLAAAARTVRECGIDPACFSRFFASMERDLDVATYPAWSDLVDYMDGSAAVIGEMMLPVLRPSSSRALGPARALGLAFQLTNFLRDVGEDLDRGRVYLPQEDLARFGVDLRTQRVSEPWRELMRFEIARNRRLYTAADAGLAHLHGAAARCVGTARVLYAGILDAIEAADYDVFSARVRVPTWRKAGAAASGVLRRPVLSRA